MFKEDSKNVRDDVSGLFLNVRFDNFIFGNFGTFFRIFMLVWRGRIICC